MSLRDYVDIVWRRKLVVLLVVALGLAATSVISDDGQEIGEGTFSGELTLAMNEDENFTNLLLFEQVATRTNTISDATAATLGDEYFGPRIDTAQAIGSVTDVRADPTVGTMQLFVTDVPSEENAEELLLAYSDALIDYASGREIAARDEELALLERREASILERIDELDRELDRLTAGQGSSNAEPGVDPTRLITAQLGSNLNSLTRVQEDVAVLRDQTEDQLVPIRRIGMPSIAHEAIEASPLSVNQRLIVGVALSTVLAIGLALGLQRFDARIFTRKDAETAFGLPVLAEIPRIRWWSRRRPTLYTRIHPTSRVAVGFRLLRSGLAHARASQLDRLGRQDVGRGTIVLVTSVAHQTGKTTTVSNLAVAAVDAGMSVLLVGADLRDPALHEYFDVDSGVGITEAVRARQRTGQTVLDPFVVRTSAAGISMLPHGEWVPNPGELLAQIEPILDIASRQFDLVIIDTPPMLAGNDVSELIPFADLVLLAARAGKSTIDEAQWAEEISARLEAPLCGLVLIGSRPQLSSRRRSLPRRIIARILRVFMPSHRSAAGQPGDAGRKKPQEDFVQPGLFDPPAHRSGGEQTVSIPVQAAGDILAAETPGQATPPVPVQPVAPVEYVAVAEETDRGDQAALGREKVRASTPPSLLDEGLSVALPEAVAGPTLPVEADQQVAALAENAPPAGDPPTGVPAPDADGDGTGADGSDGGDEIDLDAGLVDEDQPVQTGRAPSSERYPPPQSMSA